jgi:hypothetical protein
LSDWVNAGGNLIAMAPTRSCAGCSASRRGRIARKRLPAGRHRSTVGNGIVARRCSSTAARTLYTLAGATSLATLYSSANAPTPNPQ